MTGDDDTLDDLEELLGQTREPEPTAGAGRDETIPGSVATSDETIPAAEPALVGSDDDTIDVDPGLIRRLREQSPASDATLPRPALPAQQPEPPTEPPLKRKRKHWAVLAAGLATAVTVSAPGLATASAVSAAGMETVLAVLFAVLATAVTVPIVLDAKQDH